MAKDGMRLIDANALLGRFRFTVQANDSVGEAIAQCVKLAAILVKEAPTVDAVEVVHGRWECVEKAGVDYWCCSICENITSEYYYKPKHNYCPNCGAKMDADAAEQPEV